MNGTEDLESLLIRTNTWKMKALPPGVTVELIPRSVTHPALRAVKHYWDGLCINRRIPSRKQIIPHDLKSCLPQLLLADVLERDFRYRLLGTRLRLYFPVDATGKTMSEALAPFGAETVAATLTVYRSVVEEGAPLLVKGLGSLFARPSKFFEAVLMPLSENDKDVSMILGAFEFDWMAVNPGTP